jgi:tyrosine-protein kinase Etk/Wzc
LEKQSSIFFSANEESFNLKEFLLKYIQYWYWFVLSIIVALLAAFLYLRYTVPQYNIKASLLLRIDDKGGSGISEEDALGEIAVFKTKKNVDNEIQILKSQTLMEQVVRELGIDINYINKGHIKDNELYSLSPIKVIPIALKDPIYSQQFLFTYLGNNRYKLVNAKNNFQGEYQFGQVVNHPLGKFIIKLLNAQGWQDEIIIKINKVATVAKYYSENLQIRPPRTSTVLEMWLTDAVPSKGRDILDRLIQVYQESGIDDKNRVSSNTIKFIEERLKFLTQDLSGVERDIEKFKRGNDIVDIESQTTQSLSTQSAYDKELYEKETQLALLKSTEDYLKNESNEYALLPNSFGFEDVTLSNLINEYNKIILEREKTLKTTQESNPLVQAMNGQIGSLKSNIADNIKHIKQGATIARNNLALKSQSINSKMRAIPTKEREYLEIQRQQNIKQNLYLYLLQKREETELTRAVTTANSRLIDPASSTDLPITPNRKMIYLIALVIGALLPTTIITVQQLLNDSIKTRSDIESCTEVPILGGIGLSSSNENIVVRKGSRSGIAESFRMIRSNLDFMTTVDKKKQSILVTSSMSGEGKSFITLNLAASLALSGKKTIMLELDLRKPKLVKYLSDNSHSEGITNYLVSNISIESIVQRSTIDENLYFIGSGPIPPNPVELLMSKKMEELFVYLRKEYDYIIVDTSPIGLVTDAIVLNRLIDISLYVVRYGVTRKGQLSIVQDIYTQQKFQHPAIIFNAVKTNGGYGYGNGYGYGYGYGYYDDEKKNKGIMKKLKNYF